jgi:hypothetical protein
MRRLLAVLGLGLLALPVSCAKPTHECTAAEQCKSLGPTAMCESGWCSAADPACASGRRFGPHAGDGLAGECVPTEPDGGGTMASFNPDDGSGDASGSSGSGATSDDPSAGSSDTGSDTRASSVSQIELRATTWARLAARGPPAGACSAATQCARTAPASDLVARAASHM